MGKWEVREHTDALLSLNEIMALEPADFWEGLQEKLSKREPLSQQEFASLYYCASYVRTCLQIEKPRTVFLLAPSTREPVSGVKKWFCYGSPLEKALRHLYEIAKEKRKEEYGTAKEADVLADLLALKKDAEPYVYGLTSMNAKPSTETNPIWRG